MNVYEQLSIFDITDSRKCESCEHYIPGFDGECYCEVNFLSDKCILNCMYKKKPNWDNTPIIPKWHYSLESVWCECRCKAQPDYLNEDTERCPYCGQKINWDWSQIYEKASMTRDYLESSARNLGYVISNKTTNKELKEYVISKWKE